MMRGLPIVIKQHAGKEEGARDAGRAGNSGQERAAHSPDLVVVRECVQE